MKKNEKKIALYQSQREIHTVAARAAQGKLSLSSEELSAEIDILIVTHQVQTVALPQCTWRLAVAVCQ